MCRPVLQTLTLFQRTNRRNMHPISDQNGKSIPYFTLKMLENDTLWGGSCRYGSTQPPPSRDANTQNTNKRGSRQPVLEREKGKVFRNIGTSLVGVDSAYLWSSWTQVTEMPTAEASAAKSVVEPEPHDSLHRARETTTSRVYKYISIRVYKGIDFVL